ncbi:hypothetical protein B0H11DRAFT_2279204 [Mycena galericulata]|nr:hypothetical protein B0H11DRAFT_2279204 [Mycena galericulata]
MPPTCNIAHMLLVFSPLLAPGEMTGRLVWEVGTGGRERRRANFFLISRRVGAVAVHADGFHDHDVTWCAECISQELMMAVPPSTAPDVFRGSDESGIHWSTVDGRCGDPLRPAARRVNTPPVLQDLKTFRAPFGFTGEHLALQYLANLKTSRLLDLSTLGRPPSLDSSTRGRPFPQDSTLGRSLLAKLSAARFSVSTALTLHRQHLAAPSLRLDTSLFPSPLLA